MGREALCVAHVGDETASVKALLESTTVVLRGAIKRNFAIAELRELRVAGGQLHFVAGGETVALELGEAESQRWARKLNTPPPSLAAKLGVGPEARAWPMGRLDDPALAQALEGVTSRHAAHAAMLVAVVDSEAALAAAIEAHRDMPCRTAWIVHPKGPGADPSDARVRETMRSHGYVDNKTSAVSAALTATRYVKRLA